MSQINPHITFNGNCRNAMMFYKDALNVPLDIITVGQSPMAARFPTDMADSILHSSLTKGEIVLLASDEMGSHETINPIENALSLSLSCSTEDELNTYLTNLSAGGAIIFPLHDFFSGKMAVIRDPFGIKWTIGYYPNQPLA
ncbi:VOC family protein [Niabella pedocola]|uniref:VOC family protein n=1 Tax=Niabella pedocola TaxID=1752077 RepID=A0ABS8PTH4_9BACT|nr:VOC family protein [Niabella pedocola]MCD2423216.1 VOC family protein [Niabella pedocola]